MVRKALTVTPRRYVWGYFTGKKFITNFKKECLTEVFDRIKIICEFTPNGTRYIHCT